MSTFKVFILYICCMITLYEIICPISTKVVYIGITKNVTLRYTQHMWGNKKDSKEKSDWCNSLKEKNLVPILNIIESNLSIEDARKKERALIVDSINKGNNIFNINDCTLYYQYTKKGELVGVFYTIRQAKKETGILPKINGYTSGGFVWTNGVFDASKLEIYSKSKEVLCKEVHQLHKDGTFIQSFKGVREACRQTNIDHRSIAQVAGGSKIRKTAGGYKWKYI